MLLPTAWQVRFYASKLELLFRAAVGGGGRGSANNKGVRVDCAAWTNFCKKAGLVGTKLSVSKAAQVLVEALERCSYNGWELVRSVTL